MGWQAQLALLERSPIATWVTRVEPYGPIWANPRGLEFWQAASVEELLARDFSDASETTLRQLRTWQRDFGSGELNELILDWTLYPRGVPERMKIFISALELDDGQLAFLMQCVPKETDTDPKVLRDAEAMRHSSAAIALLSTQGELLNTNPAATHAFGHDAPFRAWFEDPEINDLVLAVAEHGETQTRLVSSLAEGKRRHYTLEARKTIDPVSGDEAVLVHLLDETARVGAERDAREKAALAAELRQAIATVERQRKRWRALVDSAPELIMIVDREHRVEFSNRALDPHASDPLHGVGERLEALFDPGSRAAIVAALERVFETGAVASFEATRADGRDERSYSARLGPIITDKGGAQAEAALRPTVERLVLVASDTTQRRTLEAQLRHAQKMQAMGTLAGGIAHDFNNLLMVIIGVCELAELELDAQPELAELLGEIESAAVRGSALTQQLLAFSRKRPLAPVPVELNALIEGMDKMFTRVLGEGISVEFSLAPSPCWLHADPGQLERVLMNLVVNARDAMPEGGSLRIVTSTQLAPSPEVCLEVADSGVGMDAQLRARIFDPFFTTKSQGKGTGLGLATVHGIVEQSKGRIRVHSQRGQGTRFELRFPAIAAPPSRESAALAPS